MMPGISGWLLLVCCAYSAAAGPDHILRFLSQREMMQNTQQKQSSRLGMVYSVPENDLPMEKFRAQSTICPNGITQCPDSSTCCPLTNGEYGCCEGVNAVCCKDGVHCCPEGFKCDEQHGRCTSDTLHISFHWTDKKLLRAGPLVHLSANGTCPDNKTHCHLNDTCCLAAKGYGCCPLPNAVCCNDRLHCCPKGTKCDLQHKHCYREDRGLRLPWVERRPLNPEHLGKKRAVICKDGLMCPDGDTCCLLKSGSYGCCPFTDKEEIPVFRSVQAVVCPGKQYECQNNQTCCQLPTGQWACCPYPDAVCCSDKIHCCPHGYKCDVAAGACKKPGNAVSLPWNVKKPSVPRMNITYIKCPDESRCDDGQTCCLLATGKYGCCPYSQAVCCNDKLHCCPKDYTCDVQAQSCQKGAISIPWQEKVAAVPKAQTVVCPGGQSECPDGSTCCKLSSGGYGCCLLPDAVCCKDGIHCCSKGYTCDLETKTCKKNQFSIPLVKKRPALPRAQAVICPGGQSECPDGNTCCKLSSGTYGCCPLPNAVCCSDGVHCCPSGYTCNLQKQTCDKGQLSVPWEEKQPAVPRAQTVVCPDGQSQCPDGSTCCKLSSGAYGCCPLPKAVCCADHIHCCPSGTTCNVQAGTCDSGLSSVPMMEKQPALTRAQTVVCPDGETQCPDGNTCCKLSSGAYGCCPLPDAVCCTDHIHCCPSGTTCNVQAGTCQRGLSSVRMMEKQPALPRVQAVVCPGGQTECPDGNTCCQMSSGAYQCCPLPNAVCCPDHIHCCPSGTTCKLLAGICQRGLSSVPMMEKQPALPRMP